MEFDGGYKVVVCVYFLLLLSVSQVPHPQSFVVRGRIQVLASRMQGQSSHPVVVPNKSVQKLSPLRRVESDKLVPRRSQNESLLIS